ncbi:hypothetical protein [Candidatus Viridilinea mediisalina]|uniref:Uncharacterized protein n=1 Tax=Candidatus Viridilinea mediisalina TaxID=2024553 RepID=A0A2A6RDB2_9CHLR|nr:hypothetical protein [Candidatus Viridilinea mediisalina]PDW00191.1 hypothetical protein CJ255_20965 [Candidatus Viridilinea mediisalina]
MFKYIIVVLIAGCGCLLNTGCNQNASTDDLVISYRRTGGMLNLDDHLRLYTNGQVELERKGQESTFMIDPNDVTDLTSTLDQIPFSSLRSASTNQGADYIHYELRYQRHTVRIADPELPAALIPVLEELDGLILNQGQP